MQTLISDMKLLADAIEKVAFDMPPPNPFTPQFVQMAITARRLAQEAEQRHRDRFDRLKEQIAADPAFAAAIADERVER